MSHYSKREMHLTVRVGPVLRMLCINVSQDSLTRISDGRLTIPGIAKLHPTSRSTARIFYFYEF